MRYKLTLSICTCCAILLTIFSACTKGVGKVDDCEQLACAQALPVIILDFVDAQGRDLLNVSTPAHYDSLKIIQLNSGGVTLLRPGVTPPNINRRKMLIIPKSGENVAYLKLSDTDQDTIYYNLQVNNSCCINHTLTAFKYNNKTYTDSVARHYFTIIK